MYRWWSNEDLQWLVQNYSNVGLIECSKYLNRSQASILHKACRNEILKLIAE